MTLGQRCQQIIDGLDAGNSTEEVRGDAQRLLDDLELSGASAVEVVRDADDQPPVVSNMTPEGAVG